MNEKYVTNEEIIDNKQVKEDFPIWEKTYIQDKEDVVKDIIPNVGIPYTNISVSKAETYPYAMICHFEMEYYGINSPRGGTGTFIGPKAILTAAHNVYNKIESTEYKIKRMKVTPCGGLSTKYGSLILDFRDQKNRYYYRTEWKNDVSTKNRTYDYALITIPIKFEVSGNKYFKIGELGDLRTHVNLLAARKLGNSGNQFFESETDNDPQKEKNLKVYGNNKGTLIHYFNTEDQASGGPLFTKDPNDSYSIFGIHSAGVGSRLNLACQVTENTVNDISIMLGK